jgi:hypothetical protein
VFHVEIRERRGLRRAWEFNLSRERLDAEVLAPWQAGERVSFGDQDWEPEESEIVVLEGPQLDPVDLSYGQGPNAAERTATEVTRSMLGEAKAAADDRAREAAAELLAELSALDDVSPQNEQALGLVAERLRSLGLG